MRASWLVCTVAWIAAAAQLVQAQPSMPDIDRLLTGGLTPGTAALLVEHVSRPEALARLDAALRHTRPDVRAAAARVAFVVGARGLLPTMAAMLAVETHADPAAEMTRALATLGDPTRDDLLIEVWARLGRGTTAAAAVAYAAARGPSALEALSRLRAIDDSAPVLTAFIRSAQPEPARLLALIGRAIDTNDPLTFQAALSVAASRDVEVADALLIRALESARPPDLRGDTARHVLGRRGDGPLAATLTTALAADAPLSTDASDPEGLALREFVGRAAGRPPTTSREWLAQFDEPDNALADLIRMPRVFGMLTALERRQLGRALPSFRQGPVPVPPPNGGHASAPAVHLLDAYPVGFMPDLITTTGCNLAKAKSQGLGAGAAQLTLRPDGRVARVSLMDTGVSQAGCVEALRVLFMTHVTRGRPATDEQWIAVAPFDNEYIACRESQAHHAFGQGTRGRGRVTPPKKTRHVDPVYPASAIRSGVQGLVLLGATIGTNGCVGDLHVTSGVDPRLDLSALLSVLGWRFTPSLVAGVAVPVIMTVTVQFTLR